MSSLPKRAEQCLLYWRELGYEWDFISGLMEREFKVEISPRHLAKIHGYRKRKGATIDPRWIKEYLPDEYPVATVDLKPEQQIALGQEAQT